MKLSVSSNIAHTGPVPDRIRSGKYSCIEINLSDVDFFEPSILTRVKCVIELAKKHKLEVSIIPPAKESAKNYAGGIGLFEGTTYKYSYYQTSSIFFPLLKIVNERDDTLHEKCREIFNDIALDSLADVLSELTHNSYCHSGPKKNTGWGYVYAQIYNEKKLIKIAVSDVGIGFLESYRRLGRDNGKTEAQIIQDAFNPLESSQNPENGFSYRGIGLHEVLNFAKQYNVRMRVFSGKSCIEFSKDKGLQPNSLDYTVCGVLFELEVPIK